MGKGESRSYRIESYYTGHQRLEENPYRAESKAYILFGFLAEHTFGRFRLFVNVEYLTSVRQTRWNLLLRPNRGIDGRWSGRRWTVTSSTQASV